MVTATVYCVLIQEARHKLSTRPSHQCLWNSHGVQTPIIPFRTPRGPSSEHRLQKLGLLL